MTAYECRVCGYNIALGKDGGYSHIGTPRLQHQPIPVPIDPKNDEAYRAERDTYRSVRA